MANYTMEIRELMNEPMINGVFTFEYPFYSDNPIDKEEFENLFIQVCMLLSQPISIFTELISAFLSA